MIIGRAEEFVDLLIELTADGVVLIGNSHLCAGLCRLDSCREAGRACTDYKYFAFKFFHVNTSSCQTVLNLHYHAVLNGCGAGFHIGNSVNYHTARTAAALAAENTSWLIHLFGNIQGADTCVGQSDCNRLTFVCLDWRAS